MKFYEEHAAERDRFEILAFHLDPSAKSIEELEGLMRPLEQYWGGKPLPFPVLIDTTGETDGRYGITGFPTMVLVDPEGVLVGEANEEVLAARLAEVDPEVLALAASLQAARGAAQAEPVVAALLEKGGPAVRTALEAWARACPDALAPMAFDALARLGDERSAAVLLGEAGLASDDARRRTAAARALGALGAASALEPLLARVDDAKERPEVVAVALAAAGRLAPTDARAAAAALALAGDRRTDRRALGAEALGAFDTDEAYDTLTHLLQKDRAVKVRAAAARGLAASPREGAVALLEAAAADDPAKTVRDAAAAALAERLATAPGAEEDPGG